MKLLDYLVGCGYSEPDAYDIVKAYEDGGMERIERIFAHDSNYLESLAWRIRQFEKDAKKAFKELKFGPDWIGVDFDGTLVNNKGGASHGEPHTCAPVPVMVERVKKWLAKGRIVKIFTARAAHFPDVELLNSFNTWCIEHIGQTLEVTNIKTPSMMELWDDRAVGVERNTGMPKKFPEAF